MELLQLTYFCDAAERENFSRTAEHFGVPTSNISQTVKRLETELGVKLFLRQSNRIALSEEGRVFYRDAKRALRALDDARTHLSELTDEVRGEIRISIRSNRRIATLAIEKYKRLYSGVQIVVSHGEPRTNMDYDFVISSDSDRYDGGVGRLILTERILLATDSTSHLASLDRVDVASLADERFVSFAEGSSLSRLTDSICRGAGFIPNVAISTDDPHYVRKYVEMGLGIALVPEISWRGLFSEQIKLLDIGNYTRSTYLYTADGHTASHAARLFYELLLDTFSAEANKTL